MKCTTRVHCLDKKSVTSETSAQSTEFEGAGGGGGRTSMGASQQVGAYTPSLPFC